MNKPSPFERITLNSGGQPILRQSGLTIRQVLGMLAASDFSQMKLEGCAGIEPEDIRACLIYAQSGLPSNGNRTTKVLYPDHAADNVLGLENPDNYTGRIGAFQYSHQYLKLSFSKPTEPHVPQITLQFSTVAYLDLRTVWTGGNLKTATAQECWSLVDELGFMKSTNTRTDAHAIQQSYLEQFRLFLMDTPTRQGRFLAHKSTVVQEN